MTWRPEWTVIPLRPWVLVDEDGDAHRTKCSDGVLRPRRFHTADEAWKAAEKLNRREKAEGETNELHSHA